MKFFFTRQFLISCFLAFYTVNGLAQVNVYNMDKWQDSLVSLADNMFKHAEPERLEKNFTFIKTLVSALKERHSFSYPFAKLDRISLLQAPDGQFRIFSWNIPLNDGSFLYYGAIQTKTKNGDLQLVPLLDKTFEIEKPEQQLLAPNSWYGAQYYAIAKLGEAYVLLGWKGHNPQYTQKVIEILQFNGNAYHLGKAVFSDDEKCTRKLFRFTRQASMYLRFDADRRRVVFDHISPIDSSSRGDYGFHGPDLTYDAYYLEQDRLLHRSNITFNNDEQQFMEKNRLPGKAIPGKRSGL